MNQIKRFRRLLIFSGLFNIFLAFPLIFPSFYKTYIELIYNINRSLGLGGIRPNLPDDGLSQLLINTAGIDLVLIGSIVLVASLEPVKFRLIPLLNAIGRILFAVIVAYYVIVFNIIHFVLVIGIIDVLISIGFIYFLFQTKPVKNV